MPVVRTVSNSNEFPQKHDPFNYMIGSWKRASAECVPQPQNFKRTNLPNERFVVVCVVVVASDLSTVTVCVMSWAPVPVWSRPASVLACVPQWPSGPGPGHTSISPAEPHIRA